MEFHVLGPLEAVAGGRRLDIGGNRQQIVLASLVLEAGTVISIDRLMTAVYGESLPSSARVQVQICVSALRRLLGAHGRPQAIVTRNQGYVLVPDGIGVDLHRYERLVREARAAGDTGRREDATARYREALALWRGPALEGLDSEPLRMVADRFAERRLTINEDCIEYDLELGRHREVIPELAGLVAVHPLRERLRGQLMLALYRSGRQAEALDAYRAARRTLIDELGLEPSEWLQRLEQAILTSSADLGVPERAIVAGEAARPSGPGGTAPCMLPTDIADFTGRGRQIDAIELQLVTAAANPGRLAVPIIVVAGKPGIGKTALGVHVSHRLASRFPDGQLFADLHGRSSDRVSPMRILERFLRALGVPGTAIPDGLEERAEMYRGLLSDRRMLVVLDNAGSEAQVLPLLPGSPRTAVLITAGNRLGALPGAVHVDIDVLEPSQCLELLARIAGADRVRAEREASEKLGDLCGGLPLALRIAGARLSARPHWTVGQLVDRLENESRRLDELNHGALGVRVSISITYDNISEPARRLFRLIAVVDCPDFSAWVCAALLDEPLPDAHDLLDELVDAQLVETVRTEHSRHRQYRMHDLIRVFARERLAAEEPPAERTAALRRVFGGMLFLAEEAHRRFYGPGNHLMHSPAARRRLPPQVTDRILSDPLDWFERERQCIVAAIRQAAKVGAADYSWDLTIKSITLFELRDYLNDWRETTEIALAATQQAGDGLGQAVIRYSMGSLAVVENRLADARRYLDEAVALFEALGEEHGAAVTNRHLAYLERMGGELGASYRRYEQALTVLRRVGDMTAAAHVLHNMAQVELDRGEPAKATALLVESLEVSRRAGSRRIEAQALYRLGQAHLQSGDVHRAVTIFGDVLAATRDLGDLIGESYALLGLGTAHLADGDHAAARAALSSGRERAATSGKPILQARIEFRLGELELDSGSRETAIARLERARDMFREMRAPMLEEDVLTVLARVKGRCGIG
ncbi:BTAD domain-containing putative transcriptional regulator [Actinoplanes sp. NPDC049802]|uniref:AfsR/SARP family transcriptional regulator n=1 Tax=Actinoplanes sp. NPDC049802 TaxID=3154742 RepID=UPI0033EE8F42